MKIKTKIIKPDKGWATKIMNNIIWGKNSFNPNLKNK